MSPRSALDVVSSAFEHTRQQVWPPRWSQWWRLALVGLATGELGTFGCNAGGNFPNLGQSRPAPTGPLFPNGSPWDTATIALMVTVALIGVFVLILVAAYINSICRFILIDAIVTRRCDSIRASWRRWRSTGRRYFLWRIGFMVGAVVAIVFFVGIPAGIAAGAGWFNAPNEHIGVLLLGGFLLAMTIFAVVVLLAFVYIFGKDFVAPVMAVDGVGVLAAWGRLWSLVRHDKLAFFGYAFVKFVMSIGAGIATFVAMMVVLVPMILAGAVIIAAGSFEWTPATIAAALTLGIVLLLWLSIAMALFSVPFIVFFPAYGLYFLASRYESLDRWLRIDPIAEPLPPASNEPPSFGRDLPPLPDGSGA